jgi:hypothetical protein
VSNRCPLSPLDTSASSIKHRAEIRDASASSREHQADNVFLPHDHLATILDAREGTRGQRFSVKDANEDKSCWHHLTNLTRKG